MAIKSVIRGWECEGCGINRNTTQEVHRDCACGNEEMMGLVEIINQIYWEWFWNMEQMKND